LVLAKLTRSVPMTNREVEMSQMTDRSLSIRVRCADVYSSSIGSSSTNSSSSTRIDLD
jgi:hypothetical protein